MTQVNAVVNLDINTGQASAHLRALQTQINAFQSSLNTASLAHGAIAKENTQRLVDMTNASRFFTAETIKMRTAASQLDNTLSKGRGTMGQWLGARFAKDGQAAAAVMQLAHTRAAALQTQFVATGAAAGGFQEAIAIKPLAAFNATAAVTNERLAIQRAMFTQATTSMINFGKNTQWAGRQLMVGFTVPLTMFGVLAGKTFMDLQKEVVNFKKVYGDAFTTPEELNNNLKAIQKLSGEFTKWGVAAKDTMALAAQAAAAGNKNADLIDATTQSTRLATLGQLDQQKALQTTIALHSAFGLSGQNLAKTIDYLNMVENQTVLTLQDMTDAIPRVAPVIKGLGGSVQDLTIMLTAMREGGVTAAQGANALKSGLASLINPTDKAVEKLAALGINLNNIIQSNRGDLMGTVRSFAEALSQLDKFSQQQALEKVFGKYQYARLGALFNNIIRDGSQASKAMDAAGMSATQLATVANKELGIIQESAGTKLTAAMEKFKLAIAPIGELFVKMATPIVGFFTTILEKFNSLPDFAKNFIGLGTVITGIVIPAGTMFLGLLMNLTGTLLKFGHIIGVTFKGFLSGGVKGALAGVSQSLQYMSLAEMDAANAAKQLATASESVNAALLAQVGAAEAATAPVMELATAYSVLATRMAEAAAMSGATGSLAVPGDAMLRARTAVPRRLRRAFGGGIPGVGNSDSVPAMLTPGEFVVNKDAAARNLPLLHAINQTKSAPQFKNGMQHAVRGGPISAAEAAIMRMLEVGNAPSRQSMSIASRSAWPADLRKITSLTDSEIDWINKNLARVIRGEYGYSGSEDASFLNMLPLGTAALRSDSNQALRLGRGNALDLARQFATKGPDNPLAPLFRTKAVGQYLDSMGRPFGDLFGGLQSSFVSELKAFGGAPMHDSHFYEIAQRAFGSRGAGDFYEFLRSRESSGGLRSGFSQNVSQFLLAQASARGEGRTYGGIFSKAFGSGYSETQLSGRRASIITLPDGSMVGIASGKTQDRPGFNSYQRTPVLPGTDRAHFQEKGLWIPRYAAGGSVFLGMPVSQREVAVGLAQRAALSRANQLMNTKYSSMPETLGLRVAGLNSGRSSTFLGANGIYEINGQKMVVKFHDTDTSAQIEMNGTMLAREMHGLNTPHQTFIKMRHPVTGDLLPAVASPFDPAFANPTGSIPKDAIGAHLLASVLGNNRDLQPDNMFGRNYPDVGAAMMGIDRNGNPSAMTTRGFGIPNVSAVDQLGINLLMTRGGAKRWFAEYTSQFAQQMTGREYESMMRAEIARAREALPRAISKLQYLDAEQQAMYMSKLTRDLNDLDSVNWAAIRDHHASVKPAPVKPQTAAALAKAAEIKAMRMRQSGAGGFGRYGIPFLSGGGLLGNFELDNSSGMNLYRNRSGVGSGISTFFGRMMPPTTGHGMMMDQTMLHALATGSDFGIFTTLMGGKNAHSPIPLDLRLAAILEGKGIHASGTANAYTLFDALKAAGYSDVARIIGQSDMGSDSFGRAALSRGMSSSLVGIPRDLSGVSGTRVREAALSGSIGGMRRAGFLGGSPETARAILSSIMLHRAGGGIIGISEALRHWATSSAYVRSEASLREPLMQLIQRSRLPKDMSVTRRTTVGLSKGSEFTPEMAQFLLRATPEQLAQVKSLAIKGPFSTSTGVFDGIDDTVNRIEFLRGVHAKERRYYKDALKTIAKLQGKENLPPWDQAALDRSLRRAAEYRSIAHGIGAEIKSLAPNGYRILELAMNMPKGSKAFKLNQQNYMGRPLSESEHVFGSGTYNVTGIKEIWNRGARPFNTGGQVYESGSHPIVPGVGNSDSVPAILTPGEFVVNKAATARNRSLLHAINTRPRKFAEGGEVPKVPFGMGKGMGLGMGLGAAGGAIMMAPGLMPGMSPALSGLMSGGGMALSMASMLPMLGLGGPVTLAIAGVAGAAVGLGMIIKNMMESQDEASRKAAEFGANLGEASNSLRNIGAILGKSTPLDRQNQLKTGLGDAQLEQAANKFAGILQSENFQSFIEELKNASSEDRVKKLGDYLREAIASGMMKKSDAQDFARVVGLILKDPSVGAGVANALVNQKTGAGAMLDLAKSRAIALSSDANMKALMSGQPLDGLGGSQASAVIGGSMQIIQQAAQAEAFAKEQLSKGKISYEEYSTVIAEAKDLQNQYNAAIQTALDKTNDFGSTMQGVKEQMIKGGFMTDEQWGAIDSLTNQVQASGTPVPLEGISVKPKNGLGTETVATAVPQDQWGDYNITGTTAYDYGQVVSLKDYMAAQSAAGGPDSQVMSKFKANFMAALMENPSGMANYANIANRIAGDAANGVVPDQALRAAYVKFSSMPGMTQANAFNATELVDQFARGQISSGSSGNRQADQFMQDRLNRVGAAAATSYAAGGGNAADFQSFILSTPENKRIKVSAQFIETSPEKREQWMSDFYNIEKSLGPDLATEITLSTKYQGATDSERTSILSGIDQFNNLPTYVEKSAIYKIEMKGNGGQPLTREQAEAAAKWWDKTFKNLGSKNKAVVRSAELAIASKYNGKKVSTAQMAAIRGEFKNWDKLLPEDKEEIFKIEFGVIAKFRNGGKFGSLGLDTKKGLKDMKKQLQPMIDAANAQLEALKAMGAQAPTGAISKIQDDLDKYENAMTVINNGISRAANIADSGSSGGSSSGSGGGSGGGTKSILKTLQDSFKQLSKVYDAIAKLGADQAKKAKGFIAGPFAPQFIEYLKSQGEEGVKILTGSKEKFMQVYKAFVAEQTQLGKNYLQTLPMNLLAQRREAEGQNILTSRLVNAGASREGAQSVISGMQPGEAAAYAMALQKKKEHKKLTKDEIDLLERYNQKNLRRIALELKANQIQADSQSRKENLESLRKEAEIKQKLTKMGFDANTIEELSQVPGILQMSNAEINKYLESLNAIKRLDMPALLAQQRDIDMQINDTRRQIAEIDTVKPLQDELDSLQRNNDALSHAIELKQRELTVFDDAIAKIETEKDAINATYDLRIKALEKVENVNKRIAEQQQAQLNIASALSRGDIGAAAEAMLNAQQQAADSRLQDTRDAVEQARQNDLAVKDKAINDLKAQRAAVEAQIKTMQDQQIANSDVIYNKQLNINNVVLGLSTAFDNSKPQRAALEADLNRMLGIAQGIRNAINGASTASTTAPTSDPNGPGMWIEQADGRFYNPVTQAWRAFGGVVPGFGNSDMTRIMAMPGEFVVNKPAAKAWGPLLHAINSNVFPNVNLGSMVPKVGAGHAAIQYTYGDINVSVSGTDLNPDDVANAIVYKIQRAGDRQIKGVKVNG